MNFQSCGEIESNRRFEFGGVSMIEICSNCGNHAWDKEIIGN